MFEVAYECNVRNGGIDHINKPYVVSWEPEGRYCYRAGTMIATFWF